MQLGGDGGEQWHSVLRIEGQLSDAAKQLVQLVGDRAIARCRLYQSLAEDFVPRDRRTRFAAASRRSAFPRCARRRLAHAQALPKAKAQDTHCLGKLLVFQYRLTRAIVSPWLCSIASNEPSMGRPRLISVRSSPASIPKPSSTRMRTTSINSLLTATLGSRMDGSERATLTGLQTEEKNQLQQCGDLQYQQTSA